MRSIALPCPTLRRDSVPLNRAFVASLLLLAPLAVTAQAPARLTVRALYEHGPLSVKPPAESTWSPDGKLLTYMDAEGLEAIDASTAARSLLVSRAQIAGFTAAETNEKDRDHRDRYGMASYLWAPDSAHILFNQSGNLWLYDRASKSARKVASSGQASGDDPQFSPDGKALSFLKGNSLTVVRLDNTTAEPVTVAASDKPELLKGNVDWVYEEELGVRTNIHWAPDAAHLAFLEMDESQVPLYPLTDWIPRHAQGDWQRYPQPGDPEPAVRVGVVSSTGGATVWIKLPGFALGSDYIPRFGWADAQTVWVEVLSRDQRHRSIYFADAATGESRLALALTDAKFLDEQYEMWVGQGSMVIPQWNDGHNHLYLYRYNQAHPATATLERQLTSGNFEVLGVSRADLEAGRISYTSNEGNPLEQQLWQVDFHGKRVQLSHEAGHHDGSFAPGSKAWSDRYSTRTQPVILRMCSAAGCKALSEPKSLKPYTVREPIAVTVAAHDGTTLYGTLLLPEGASATHSVPLIVNPYGGPGAQTVVNAWSDGLLFDQLLTEHGFAVLHADNRGMGHRGQAFAQAAWHNFGPVQLEDQLTVVDDVLRQYPVLDPKRLGWWGWSWGGSFTLYTMSHSDRFRAGVSVAPVTDWAMYDSIYTERYMDRPADDASAYHDQSDVSSAANLSGHLLLVHGTGDDNVHPANTMQYVQKLIEADKPYDLQLYPRKTHSIAGAEARIHLYERILHHFEQYLLPTE